MSNEESATNENEASEKGLATGNKGPEKGDPKVKMFTQEQVNKIVQTQKIKASQSAMNDVNARLNNYGFENGLEGFEEAQRVAKEQRTQELEEKNQYKELYETYKADTDKALVESRNAHAQTKARYQDEKVTNRIMSAAKDAVSPEQVAQLVRNNIKTDPEGNIYVVDEIGSRLTDQQGNFLSIESYLDLFLDKNPHFRKAAPGRGISKTSVGNNPSPMLDRSIDYSDPDFISKNKKDLIAKIRSGEIT